MLSVLCSVFIQLLWCIPEILSLFSRALSLSFTMSLRDDTILNTRAHQVCACTMCDIDIRFPFDVFSAIISTYANLCRDPRKQNKIRINVLFLVLYSSQPKELPTTKSRPEIDAHPRNLEIEMGHHNHKTNRNDRIVLYTKVHYKIFLIQLQHLKRKG